MFISTRISRLGLSFFAVYLVAYGVFVLLAAFSPDTMDVTLFAGVNLAIWYGFGLIVAAIVLALIYGWLCRVVAEPPRSDSQSNEGAP